MSSNQDEALSDEAITKLVVESVQQAVESDEPLVNACKITVAEKSEKNEQNEHLFEIDTETDEESSLKRPGEYFTVDSYEEVSKLLQDYFERTSSSFTIYKRSTDFGFKGSDIDFKGKRISWEDKENPDFSINSFDLPFDGVPRMNVANLYLQCQFGHDQHAKSRANNLKDRREQLEKEIKEGKDVTIKMRNLKIRSKKFDCPVRIAVKQVIKFPGFEIAKRTRRRMRDASIQLKNALEINQQNVHMEVLYMGRLPDVSNHKNHLLDNEYYKEPIHPDIVTKIQDLYMQSHSNCAIMEICKDFVLNQMFYNRQPPNPKRRKYYPNRKDVRNITNRIRFLSHCSKDQEQCIQTFIEQVKSENEYLNISFLYDDQNVQQVETESSDDEFFEPDSIMKSPQKNKKTPKKPSKESTFLFCCQTPKQQRLLKRYGNVVFVVRSNGTSRTVPFQMYNVMVQTNVDYQTVCSMIISRQRKDGIKDGLTMLKDWNTYWRPKYFMVDCNKEIYDAVDEVFPDASFFLNPQSCENEWMEFLKIPSNELVEQADEVMAFLKNMAYSFTEDSLTIAAAFFEGSDIWSKSLKLRTWFQATWLHLARKWVFGYRPEDLLIVNHWKVCPSECVKKYRQASVDISNAKIWLETIIHKISTSIPEEEYREYIDRNKELYTTSKKFSQNYPTSSCHQGIPMAILPQIYDIGKLSTQKAFDVTDHQLGLFAVKYDSENPQQQQTDASDSTEVVDEGHSGSKGDDIESSESDFLQSGEFTVSFGDLCNYPYCTCPYWQIYKLPCVHMFAVFCKIPDWKYDMLSPLYRCANVFQFDYSCINAENLTTVDFGSQAGISNFSNDSTDDVENSNIFVQPSAIPIDANLLKQCDDFLQHFNKLAFLFKKKALYRILRHQLELLRDDMEVMLHRKRSVLDYDLPIMKKSSGKMIHTLINLPKVKVIGHPKTIKAANHPKAIKVVNHTKTIKVVNHPKTIKVTSNSKQDTNISKHLLSDSIPTMKSGEGSVNDDTSSSPITTDELVEATKSITYPTYVEKHAGAISEQNTAKLSSLVCSEYTTVSRPSTLRSASTSPRRKSDSEQKTCILKRKLHIDSEIKGSVLDFLPKLKTKCVDEPMREMMSTDTIADEGSTTSQQTNVKITFEA